MVKAISAALLSLASLTTPVVYSKDINITKDLAKLKSIMEDEGILLAQTLEKHVDTNFNLGEVQPTPLNSTAPSAVPSAAASVTSDASCADNNQQDEADIVPKIVAAGKGGALYFPSIFSKVIELSGKDQPNVVYIGTASFDADKNYNRHSGEFKKIGCEVQRLDVSEQHTVPSHEEMRRLVVDWADVIVCSGGNTLHALLRWKDTGLDVLLKEAAQNGTVLCGGSAGAGCWFNSMHSDSLRPDNVKHAGVVKEILDDDELEDWDYVKISGLGIIPGPEVMAVPHFDTTGTNDIARSEHAEQVLVETEGETPGAIGIDNNAAMVIEGDKAMVVSGDGEATCHVVVADGKTGETSVAPLPQEEPAPLEELIDLARSNL